MTGEWSPYDEDSAKVHYDLATWNPDQQSDLVELLVEAEIAHGWEGTELIVPDWAEAIVDGWCENIEQETGVVVDGPEVEFDLSEWSSFDLSGCAECLVANRIPHRWEQSILVVSATDAQRVEKVIDSLDDFDTTFVEAEDDHDL